MVLDALILWWTYKLRGLGSSLNATIPSILPVVSCYHTGGLAQYKTSFLPLTMKLSQRSWVQTPSLEKKFKYKFVSCLPAKAWTVAGHWQISSIFLGPCPGHFFFEITHDKQHEKIFTKVLVHLHIYHMEDLTIRVNIRWIEILNRDFASVNLSQCRDSSFRFQI